MLQIRLEGGAMHIICTIDKNALVSLIQLTFLFAVKTVIKNIPMHFPLLSNVIKIVNKSSSSYFYDVTEVGRLLF